jgi:hypothetical protein
MHHSPYSSGLHGSNAWMQWPYRAWGASAVLAGHDHLYERIVRDGFPYFINGLGGAGRYGFGEPVTGSVVRYVANHGAMRVTASETSITYEMIAIDGTLVDSYTQTGGCPTATATRTPTRTATPMPTRTLTPTPTATTLPCCDLNRDGRVDILDIQLVAAAWGSANSAYDFNGNGTVDTADVMHVASRWHMPN